MYAGIFRPAYFLEQAHEIELSVEAVHFGQFALQLFQIALRETAHDVDTLELALFLALNELQDGADTLFLGIAYEAAGVDDGGFALRVGRIVHTTPTRGFQLPHEPLCVHQILRAAQRYDIYLVLVHRLAV